MFVNYNDFELIYLIQEGSEQALNLMYHKYLHWIVIKAKNIFPYNDKCRDLIQEGRILFFNCVKKYNSDLGSFFTFFTVCLERRYNHLLKDKYYERNVIYFNEKKHFYNSNIKHTRLFSFKNDIDTLLYEQCIMSGMSIKSLCELYNLDYFSVYHRFQRLKEFIKKFY